MAMTAVDIIKINKKKIIDFGALSNTRVKDILPIPIFIVVFLYEHYIIFVYLLRFRFNRFHSII